MAVRSKIIRTLLTALLVGSSGFLIGFMYTISEEKPTIPDKYKISVTPSVGSHLMSNLTLNNATSLMLPPNASSGNLSEDEQETFLRYNPKNFSYPSHFNLEEVVKEAITQNTKISEEYTKINEHSFRYIHLPKQCQFPADGQRHKNMVILVKSSVGNFDLRKTQRALLKKYSRHKRLKQVFLLGYNDNEILQNRVDTENEKYEDIVQEDFIDAYLNNTFKTVMSYNWVNQYCTSAAILFFIDDDYYVYYEKIIEHIYRVFTNRKRNNIFSGTLASKAVPYRRNETVWSLTFDQYPYDLFPPYIGGGAYIVSQDVAQKFALSFPYVQFLGIDDAYLGIVAKKLSIVPSYDSNFDTSKKSALAKECSHEPSELANQHCPIAIRKSTVLRRRRRRPRKPLSWLDILPMIILLNVFFMIAVWCSN